MDNQAIIFTRLMEVVEERKQSRPPNSYTRTLLEGGVKVIGSKLCEEAGEVAEAALLPGSERRAAIVHEAADLVYHLFVMLACCDVGLADVEAELQRRFGVSGLDEKAGRPSAS
jgi:phosphoribosyl-ATP pyrophosphohydrolase